MQNEVFDGARKEGRWLLADAEQHFVRRNLHRVPRWLETYHLTLLTLPWCALTLLSGYLAARFDVRWLCLGSACIALQYLTDLFDGAIGRHRKTGLLRWGFFMDHLLDYAFLCSVLGAWGFLLPQATLPWLVAAMGLGGALMASSFLAFASTNAFRISHFGVGPTEMRLLAIGINQCLVVWGAGLLERGLAPAVVCLGVALGAVTYRTHRRLWSLDMKLRGCRAEEV